MDAAARPKRFYETASVEAAEAGWAVALDGRAVKTPAKAGLVLPSEALAEAVAAEWAGQGERIDLTAMHLTKLANVAIDRTPAARNEMAAEVARYAETDLVCHLADGPADLRARQDAAWTPHRVWAGQALGVVLVPVEGIVAAPQPPASLDAAKAHAASLDDFRLTGLAYACGLLGSAVLALAVERGTISAPEAFDLSRLDEVYQAERWGEDSEAVKRTEAQSVEIASINVWFGALRIR
ncbi:MAG: ATP12 family protein [Pseudomonadota bacterium]